MTMVQQVYNWLLDGNEITGKQIADLIKEARPRHDVMVKLYERYKGTDKGVPILTRTYPIQDTSKINNKVANDFFTDIIDTKTGYMAGRPITYQADETFSEKLQDFNLRNAISDLDSESIKNAAIAGYCARLAYINLEGEAALINVPAWETIFICDEMGVTDADYAIRYYVKEDGLKKYTCAEFYDDEKVSFWIREEDSSFRNDEAFVPDTSQEANPQAHLMGCCPLICFPNNEEMLGDCEKVLGLIDGYDRTVSDVNSEIEQFRLAYLAIYGMNVDKETIDKMRQTGAISFPETDSRAEFIIKNLNDVVVENHLNRLENSIYRFAKSVDTSDINFAANTSGVAMKYKLFGLESKCIVTERKFTKALYRQFEALKGYWEKRGVSIDPYTVKFVWVRNFPLDLMSEAQALATLKGLVSDETAYAQMSFIEDPAQEIEQVKAEQDEYMKAQMELNAAAMAQEQSINNENTNVNTNQGGQ